MNKKGVSLSMEFIIIAALALLALIVIALFFTGGAEKLFGKQKGAVGVTVDPQIKGLATSTCQLSCTLGNKDAYEHPNFPKEVKAQFDNCEQLLGQSFEDRCGRCVKSDELSEANCAGKDSKADCQATTGCKWE